MSALIVTKSAISGPHRSVLGIVCCVFLSLDKIQHVEGSWQVAADVPLCLQPMQLISIWDGLLITVDGVGGDFSQSH